MWHIQIYLSYTFKMHGLNGDKENIQIKQPLRTVATESCFFSNT